MKKTIYLVLSLITVMPIVAMIGNVGPTESYAVGNVGPVEGYAVGNVGPVEGYAVGNVGPKQDPKAEQFQTLSDEDRQLIIAVDRGDESLVRALLEKGANPGLKTFTGESLTVLATRKGYDKIVRLLSKAKL